MQTVIESMRLLTPGDFAAVYRRNRFNALPDAQALVDALSAECRLKEGGNQQRIDFV